MNGNIGLSIFEPQDAKPNSWKSSREEDSRGFQSTKTLFSLKTKYFGQSALYLVFKAGLKVPVVFSPWSTDF